MVTPVSYNNIPLNDGFFSSDLQGVFDADKSLTTNNIFGDGQVFGRSKVNERKLVLRIVAGGYDLVKLSVLNRMASGNSVKPMVIDTDFGRLIGYAEVTGFAWNDDAPLLSSCQLTMPDPHWYTVQADTLSLEPHIDHGVLFDTAAILILNAGDSDDADRFALAAGTSGQVSRTFLGGPQSNV
ncbi:phage tail protein [Ethanoligenens sp.]|uniref:phage tail protein n=1 Tax=Ethanoligenens sp. TaxID=2099655 RepID=UPI0039E78D88